MAKEPRPAPLDPGTVDAYLARIGYDGPRAATPEVLRDLHVAHMLHVPFENLDIVERRPIVLETDHLVDKIIGRRRGGFCFELNGLFASLLTSLGFEVRMLSAEVHMGDGTWSPPFDHMTLEVRLDEPWLADIGFGDSFREPLRLEEPGRQHVFDRDFQLREVDGTTVLADLKDGSWEDMFRFDRTPRALTDYEGRSHWLQNAEESIFRSGRLCTRITPTGRITLRMDRFIITESDDRQEHAIADEDAYRALVGEHFGMTY